MRAKNLFSSTYAQLSAVLSQLQMGDWATDHKAEVEGWQGWSYVAIHSVMKQVSRSQVRVYDDTDKPEAKEIRKNLRAEHGWNWRKSLTREHQGALVDRRHPLIKLLERPNPAQTGASFRAEQVQQLRLHGSAIVFNRPNRLGSRTVERYVVPMSLIEAVPPGYAPNAPRGGIRIRPTSYMDAMSISVISAEGLSPIYQFIDCVIPVEMLSIARYPHPFLRGDGSSPTTAISRWIDTATHIDGVRMKFYGFGPNGQIIIEADGENVTPEQCAEWERDLNRKLGPTGQQVVVVGKGQKIVSQRTAEEMGFTEGHEQMKSGILSAHGVSRSMMGDQDASTYGAVAASLWASTLLSVQPDMDLVADEDTLDLAGDYEGDLSIEYDIPPIEDPDTTDARLAADSKASVMTVGEYRTQRGWELFGDERDDMMLTAQGAVPVKEFIGSGAEEQAGGDMGAMPLQFGQVAPPRINSGQFGFGRSLRSPVSKSMAMGTRDFPAPIVGLEVEGTILDESSNASPKLKSWCREAISQLRKCGCDVVALTSGDPVAAADTLSSLGLDLPVNPDSAVSYVWDVVADGLTDTLADGLQRVADALPDGPEARLLRLSSPTQYKYGCVLCPLPEAAAAAVRGFAESIPLEHLGADGVEMEPHVTVLYGLVDAQAGDVVKSVRRMGAPTVVVGQTIAFDSKEGVVPLVLEVQSEQLHAMNAKLRGAFAHVMTYPEYRPHITLAYVREEFADLYTGSSELHDLAIELDSAKINLPGQERVIVPLRTDIPEPVMVQAEIQQGNREIAAYDRLRSIAATDDRELVSLVKSLASKIDAMSIAADSPEEIVEPEVKIEAAGLAVMAQDTGRMLMLQRALSPDDPAAGDWEFPGGHVEEGERTIDAAKREWSEETGHVVPNGREVASWDSGIYRGHVWLIKNESQVQINLGREDKHVLNPDDPDGDQIEVVAWYSPGQMVDNGSLRQELIEAMPVVMDAVRTARGQFKQSTDWGGRLAGMEQRRDPEGLAGVPGGDVFKRFKSTNGHSDASREFLSGLLAKSAGRFDFTPLVD